MSRPEWVWDLVDLAAAQAAGDAAGMEAAMHRLRTARQVDQVEEALLQSYLFLGFPSAIEALRRWRALGTAAPRPAPVDLDEWVPRGERTCATVYGDHYDALRANIVQLHPDLDRWMVMEGYGKVLSRPGLSLDVRELLIVSMLVVAGERGRRQLRSHLKGALNAGATHQDVATTIQRASAFASPDRRELAEELWSRVRDDA